MQPENFRQRIYRIFLRHLYIFKIQIKHKTMMADIPKNYKPMKSHVFCPFCSIYQQPNCRQHAYFLYIGMTCITVLAKGEKFMTCRICTSFLGKEEVLVCKMCRCYATKGFLYCVKCGINLKDDNLMNF
ncbi:hypothetical protein EDEG_00664 [Edhazardia aedis USNM 41457]|uniref:Zinc-ribbon 15 domain-containing protein n=1 Tax=Edhazardia aedis (strain USNM 41457) TaxID=1003232 RepID=J9A035_EDHAE|nr:hypothetical protein EDEG_00664 [Edhazardia aedis USNM 41457]|eukprot:EJW05268.1 hypothetical protein EDEG_00664 [Edhazardia aedis USNM 41457]